MKLERVEKRYKVRFSKLYRELWEEGMLDWMNGREELKEGESWEKSIYPEIKENPPLLLHSGGFDFEMMREEEILNYQFDEMWDIEEHEFIPFAKTEEGNIYAFYKNMKKEEEMVVVYIWNDMNETEIIAKNFEDFIFRKMLEAVFDIDKDELKGDYKEGGFKAYKIDLLNDLKTVKPYIKREYGDILEEIYRREEQESLFSFSLISKEELVDIIEKNIKFAELDSVFEHEID